MKFLSMIVSMLMWGSALAMEVHDAPVPEGDGYKVVIFVLLFVGMCVGYFWMIFRGDKKRKQQQQKQ